ncbi:hypothetical protein [Salegentibacter chungangensis]|uniref:HEAT repeat domain-containing protein n=1 Tax=Salegentibacter chungangensis TaxID=1335724 RepID=A0ABW3NRP8_9FLAO
MSEELLLIVIKISLTVLFVLWGSIAYSLYYRRKRGKQLQEIEMTFANIVSRYLYPEPNKPINLIEIQRKLRAAGIKPGKKSNVQFLIFLLIRTQRNILGKNHRKLQVLYKQIPPFRASITKLQKKSWYAKASGIREIYEMNQGQHLPEIFPLRNHPNIYVRREAQIAMVVFLGWESLRFLPYLKRNVTLWQQIKIVEKLYDHYKEPNLFYLRKSYGAEKDFARQLIIRIIRKYELMSEIGYVLKHLDSENHEVREAAIYCIQNFRLNNPEVEVIKNILPKIPNTSQKRQLLNYISANSEIDLIFYKKLLHDSNDVIKLKTAQILWENGYKETVQEFYYEQYSKTLEYAE